MTDFTHARPTSPAVSLSMDSGRPRVEFLKDIGQWVQWEPADPDDPHYYEAVPLSATAVAELELEGMEPAAFEETMEDCSDKELEDVAQVLHLSQQLDSDNANLAEIARAVHNTQRRRSSRLAISSNESTLPSHPAPSSSNPRPAQGNVAGTSSRWAEAKEVKITVNQNTCKADKRSMKAFVDFLQQHHGINQDPTTLDQQELKKLIADYITRAKKQDGTDYQRGSLLDMVRGVLRFVNAAYKKLEIEGKPAPSAISLTSDALLSTAADSTCRQLSAAGKGIIKQQPALTPAELSRLLSRARLLAASSYRQSLRKYLWLGLNFGGRASELAQINYCDFFRTYDSDNNECIRFKPPSTIKQNQGGLKRSRGAQMLDQNPYVYICPDPNDPFLDGFSILADEGDYRAEAFKSSNKPECPRFFLQLKHTNSKGKDVTAGFDPAKYQDSFINGPLGENRFSWLLQSACELAGLPLRANHGLRRTFIHACYRAGMPEAAIMRYTRHTSIEGLRNYTGFDDAQFAEFARVRQQQQNNPSGDLSFLVSGANGVHMYTPATNLPQLPQPSPTTSRQHSSSATGTAARTTSTAWEDEFADLGDYEDTSPAPKKVAGEVAVTKSQGPPPLHPPPQPQQPAVNKSLTTAGQLPASSSLPGGINIVINAAPPPSHPPYGAPPGYPYAGAPHYGSFPAAYGTPYPHAAGYMPGGFPASSVPAGTAGYPTAQGYPPAVPAGYYGFMPAPAHAWPPVAAFTGHGGPGPLPPPAGDMQQPGPSMVPRIGWQQHAGRDAATGLTLRRSAVIDEDDD